MGWGITPNSESEEKLKSEMRSVEEVEQLIQALTNDIKTIRKNKLNWRDKSVPRQMIQENQFRIHTLEWVLGKHERFD